MKRRWLLVLSLVIIFSLSLTACGIKSGGGGSNGGGSTSGGSHNVGDAVQVSDKNLVITMTSGAISSYKVDATFTIENKGSADFPIDTKTTFQVNATDGTNNVPMTLDTLNCSSTMIKGPVPAGGKVTGDMCWRGDPTHTWPSDATISFGGAATDPGVVTWKLTAGQ